MIRQRILLLARDAATRDCLYLVKHGVPFDVAFSLEDDEREAWKIIFGEIEGGAFDADAWLWKEPKT